jgi:dehydrodolichyl diphosphate syntase complex subunit NUS1
MSWLASLALYVLHAIYAMANIVTSWREGYSAREPHPLVAKRSKLPRHVAVLLASDLDTVSDIFEQDILQNLQEVVGWCREVGIQRLTLYDRAGLVFH